MGGDGGVVATNRRYMRGAGTADHTGDFGKASGKVSYNHDEVMTTCHISHKPLVAVSSSSSSDGGGGGCACVACPFGYLYNKETAIEALLERKKHRSDATYVETSALGAQVRRLSDLYDVRFNVEGSSNSITCPITGKALTGSSVAAILLVPGKAGVPNVVSESALPVLKTKATDGNETGGTTIKSKQQFTLSQDELEAEYGPIQKRIRLAPSPDLLESTIIEQVRIEQEQEEEERRSAKAAKKDKKDKKKKHKKDKTDEQPSENKKRKLLETNSKETKGGRPPTTTAVRGSSTSLGQAVQSQVETAIQKNQVLSSLFTTNDKKFTSKEKKDNLFAR